MKKIIYLTILLVSGVVRTTAQETAKQADYKVPAAYKFDYKVTYEIYNEENKTPEKVSYYFTKNGDYMSMETAGSQKEKDMNFMISTSNGLMITFGEEPDPKESGKERNVLKVIDMHSMAKGGGENLAALAKALSKNDKTGKEEKKTNDLDNFVKTGKTKQFFGYTADEYSKHFTRDESGKERSGTMRVWYAKVDFDPEMMFSMGMGSIAGGESQYQNESNTFQ